MNPFLKAYNDLKSHGQIVAPRGAQIIELEDYKLELHPIDNRFTSFKARNINLDYAKFEFAWYLRGDRYEMSITDKAQMWKNIIDTDGGINSNYGQYIYHDQAQFDWVIDELKRDKESRRAVMTLLNHTHLREDNPDVVCTYSISFRIRNNKLNMTIHMRSWDAIWGMTNDVFCFSCIYETVLRMLQWYYPDLQPGRYTHTADSFHVYERHWSMLDKLVDDGMTGYYGIDCPAIHSADEVEFLMYHHLEKEYVLDSEWKFTRWLYE